MSPRPATTPQNITLPVNLTGFVWPTLFMSLNKVKSKNLSDKEIPPIKQPADQITDQKSMVPWLYEFMQIQIPNIKINTPLTRKLTRFQGERNKNEMTNETRTVCITDQNSVLVLFVEKSKYNKKIAKSPENSPIPTETDDRLKFLGLVASS